jgi:hypothetical protein
MSDDKVFCGCGCGIEIAAFDRWGEPHRFAKGHNMRGRRVSAETRARQSAAMKGRPLSASARAAISAANKARRYSPDERARRSAASRGEHNPAWKGGRSLHSKGYVLIRAPDHPRQFNGYIYEHILVWEASNGPLADGYCVHHLNGDKQDNRLENLEAMTIGEHSHLHNSRRRRRR